MRELVLIALIGCHHAVPPPEPRVVTPSPSASASASVDAAPAPPPETEAPVGAVPIPGEDAPVDVSQNHVDATVTLDELPPAAASWRTRAKLAHRGQVSIALHIARAETAVMELAVVDTANLSESGYPGALERYQLDSVDESDYPEGGNAYRARDEDPERGVYVGPIMFAVRVLPTRGAPEDQRRQVVVYTRGRTIFVAEKLVRETAWTPRLRIDAPRSTALVAINPGWH